MNYTKEEQEFICFTEHIWNKYKYRGIIIKIGENSQINYKYGYLNKHKYLTFLLYYLIVFYEKNKNIGNYFFYLLYKINQ